MEGQREEDECFNCPQCSASFREKRRLTEHIRRSHATEAERTCPHCKKVLKNRGSLPKHLRGCKEAPMNVIECSLEPQIIPPSPSNQHRKVKLLII